jgi:hypothetical protein
MADRIICPSCKTTNTLDEDTQQVRCRKCKALLTTPAAAEPPQKHAEAEAIQDSPRVKVKATTTRNSQQGRNDPDRPRRSSAQRKNTGSSGVLLVLLGLGTVAVLFMCVLVGGGISAFLLFRSKAADIKQEPLAEVHPLKNAVQDAEKKVGPDNDKQGNNNDDPKQQADPQPKKPPFLQDASYGRDDFLVRDNPMQWANRGVPPRVPIALVSARPNQQEGVLGPKSPLWEKLRKRVQQNRVLKTSIQNGNWGRNPFTEIPQEGAVLVGFYCNANNWMSFMQPIFLTAEGEKPGKAYGRQFGGDVIELRAKPGYAVGRIYVRAGDLFDGFGVTFMKADTDWLDPRDAYDSEFVGSTGGTGFQAGGDGAYMVGIHGRLITQGGFVPIGSIATIGGVSVKLYEPAPVDVAKDPLAKGNSDAPFREAIDAMRDGKFIQPPASTAPTSYFHFVSSPGDPIGQGKTYSSAGRPVTVKQVGRGTRVTVDSWIIMLSGPGKNQLAVGEYRDVKRFPINGNSAGLACYGEGRTSKLIVGEFRVWELEIRGNEVTRLAVDFVQRSDVNGAPLYGVLRYNSSLR